MANYTTSADLISDILFRANEPEDSTSDFYTSAIKYLNRAYQGIWSGGSELIPDSHEVWWWLRKDDQGVIILDPVVNEGSISVTNNNATITFSSAPAASQAGRHFKVDDHADVFIISSHIAATDTATLESVYTGDTNTEASYKSFKLDYDLASDLLYLMAPLIAFQSNRMEIPVIDLAELRTKWPLNTTGSGVPQNASFIGEKKLRFSHFGGTSSTDLIKIDYEYIYEPSDLVDDTAEPLVPRQYRKILADWALAFVLSDKDDDKAALAITIAREGLEAMIIENHRRMEKSSGKENFGKIHPRLLQLERLKGPLRTESGLIIGW